MVPSGSWGKLGATEIEASVDEEGKEKEKENKGKVERDEDVEEGEEINGAQKVLRKMC